MKIRLRALFQDDSTWEISEILWRKFIIKAMIIEKIIIKSALLRVGSYGVWIIHAENLHFICLHERIQPPKHCCGVWIPPPRLSPAQSFFIPQLMKPFMSYLFPCSRPDAICFVYLLFITCLFVLSRLLVAMGYWDIRIFEQIVPSNPVSTLVSPESTPLFQ